MSRPNLDHLENSALALLRSAAADAPDGEFVRIAGEAFTFGETLERVEAVARGLLELGLQPGDRVALMTRNVPGALWSWLGAGAARLIDVPLNSEARGKLLAYFFEDAEPRVLIGDEEHLRILAEAIEVAPEIVIRLDGDDRPFGDRARQLTIDELLALGRESDLTLEEPRPDDTATIMFTSGTTGPSKGVMLPQGHYPAIGTLYAWNAGLQTDDVFYTVQPLFHIDARTYVLGALRQRATVALGARFSVSRFWDEVREHDATLVGFIGTMMWLLFKAEPRPGDREHRVRGGTCSSAPYEILAEFEERFGIEANEGYGMTESVMISGNPPHELAPGKVGRAAPHLAVSIRDEDDRPLPPGEVGEICFRPLVSHTTTQGYWRKPAATVEAWRNLWFHTGDFGKEDADGQLEYIGRKKDSIRRRGENISAWEVEQAISAHPDILEAAAIGIPSEVGEEDVAVLLVAAAGRAPDPVTLIEFVERDLPSFAVPRYIEFVEGLPKTPSERVAKGQVRERGITASAWDANQALNRR